MPTYTINWTDLTGFYDGLGIIALQGVSNPPNEVNAVTLATTHSVAGGQSGPITATFTPDNVAGNCMLVYITCRSDPGFFLPDAWTISDTNGNTYVLVQAQNDGIGGGQHLNRLYKAENIVGGPNTVSIDWTKSGGPVNTNIAARFVEYEDVPTSAVVVDKTQTINVGTTFASLSLTITAFPVQIIAYDADAVRTLATCAAIASNYTIVGGADNTTSTPCCCKIFVSFPIMGCGSPPQGTVGVPYGAQVSLAGGFTPYTYSVATGALPTGLSLDTTDGTITGTPTVAGTYNYTVHVIDLNGNTADTPGCSIVIIEGPSITCDSPPDGTVGTAYTHTFPVTGGTAPYTFAIISGSLPPGLTLNTSTGVVSGTPTTSGSYSFRIQVTDANFLTDFADCGIDVLSSLDIICNSPPGGEVGIAYTHTFPATGGTPAYTFAIITGVLPTGLSLNTSTGVVSGTPSAAGVFPFTIRVTDSVADTDSVPCSITILAAPDITCDSPPDGTTGVFYTHTFPVTGGTAPFTFAIIAGTLPTGLSLNTSTGVVSGTPTVPVVSSFTIRVTDALGAIDSAACGITITDDLTIICDSPPTGEVGVSYTHTFPAGGGTAPYTFAIIAGVLPPGLSLNTSTGVVSGTPTMDALYPFTIEVTDSLANSVNVGCSILIAAAVAITCGSPPDGTVGTLYSHNFPASGGITPYTNYAIISGALPDGLTLGAITGTVSGTPTVAGTFSFTIQVTDSYSATGSVPCSITIAGSIDLICGSPPNGTVGRAYDHFLVASGGIPPYTFTVTSGILPPGLTLNSATGEITGTPTSPGTFPFVVTLTDSTMVSSDTCSISISITPPLSITCNNPPDFNVGTFYSHAFPATGGLTPYTFSFVGLLPPGLTLNTSTGVVSGVPTTSGNYVFTITVTDSLGDHVSVTCSIGSCIAVTSYPLVLMADARGFVWIQEDFHNDNLAPIPAVVQTFEWDGGDQRAGMQWGDEYLDALAPAGLIATPMSLDQAAVTGTGIPASSFRQFAPVSLGGQVLLKFLGMLLQWTDDFITQDDPTTLYLWQAALVPKPEQIIDRVGDWENGGGAKYYRGFVLEADTFGAVKSFGIRNQDDNALYSFNIQYNGQGDQPFFFVPFVGHLVRYEPAADTIPMRFFGIKWIYDNWPELTTLWSMWMNLGTNGAKYLRAAVIPMDTNGAPISLDLISSDGGVITVGPFTTTAQEKTQVPMPFIVPLIGHEFQIRPSGPVRIWYEEIKWEYEAYPELITESTPWMNLGTPGAKYMRAVVLVIATEGAPTSLTMLSSDGGSVTLGPFTTPAGVKTPTPWAFTVPLIGHEFQLKTSAPCRIWFEETKWEFEVYPELITEATPWMSLGPVGTKYMRGTVLVIATEGNPVTLVMRSDFGTTVNLGPFTSLFGIKTPTPWAFTIPLLGHEFQLLPSQPCRIWFEETRWDFDLWPELINEATGWLKVAPGSGASFLQGAIIPIETNGVIPAINLLTDTGAVIPLAATVTPIANIKSPVPYSLATPVVVHEVQLVPTSPCRIWVPEIVWVSQPTAELVYNWQTQMTSHGMRGYHHIGRVEAAYAATAAVTLTITAFDGTSPQVVILPATGGVYQKTLVTLTMNKGQAYRYKANSDQTFQIFTPDWICWIGEWGRNGEYTAYRHLGGEYGDAARI